MIYESRIILLDQPNAICNYTPSVETFKGKRTGA